MISSDFASWRLTGGDLDGAGTGQESWSASFRWRTARASWFVLRWTPTGETSCRSSSREKVSDATEFQWQSQLKHKYRETPSTAGMMCFPTRDPHLRDPPGNPETGLGGKRAEIAICDAIMPYDYEYLGNGPRLVITPLTDRISSGHPILTLMMGCAPAGPDQRLTPSS